MLAVGGLAHHLQVLGHADQLLDAFTNDGVVFRHQNSNHCTYSTLASLLCGAGRIERNPNPQRGPLPRLAVDLQRAAEHQYPLVHADQTERHALAHRRRFETPAIVADTQA
ncbi:hypothetical protein D9M72_644490 [compost metagenome]